MYAFLCNFTPRSVNARIKTAYYDGLVAAFRKYHGTMSPLSESLYGFVYYFHRIRTGLDADNLSKPIWDALNTVAYIDDKLIRYRASGIFNLTAEGLDVLDLSAIPDYLLDDFLKMIDDGKEHILYIEFGRFDYNLFQFGHEE